MKRGFVVFVGSLTAIAERRLGSPSGSFVKEGLNLAYFLYKKSVRMRDVATLTGEITMIKLKEVI
jgi:hypothetical protein